MSAILASAALLLTFAAADYNGAANSVASAAKDLAGTVSKWNSAAGLQGALAIQNGFSPFTSALNDYANEVSNAKDSDLDVASTSTVNSEVAGLLAALSEKAADFKSVGADSIAAGDLKDVSPSAQTIINGQLKLLGHDSAKWGSLSSGLLELESSVNAANSKFGVAAVNFSPTPEFSGSASSSEASSASSHGASSASSASASSASASSSSAKSTSAASAAAPAKNGTAPAISASQSKAPKVHNGASEAAIGMGAAVAGAIALLI